MSFAQAHGDHLDPDRHDDRPANFAAESALLDFRDLANRAEHLARTLAMQPEAESLADFAEKIRQAAREAELAAGRLAQDETE